MNSQSNVLSQHVSPYPTSDINGFKSAIDLEFDFDIAAAHIAATDELYHPASIGLLDTWVGKRVFLNLIDSDNIAHFLARAFASAQSANALVVALLPRRFQSNWWSIFSFKASEVRFPKGRLEHGVHRNGSSLEIALFIFRPRS